MNTNDSDFEFERRFLVNQMPAELLVGALPNVIIQTYFLAAEGFGLRVRLQATQSRRHLPQDATGKEPIELFADDFDLCMLTAKGPGAGGTRYEAERELDINVGINMSLLGGITLSKRRYGVWLGEDGWVIDQFSGDNAPLIIAECERTSPVTNLEVPDFCIAEVTDDPRFSNDALVNHPYSQWQSAHSHELLR